MAPSGGAAVAVTNDAATDWNPVWSPDGRSLIFSSNRGGSMNLWRVRMDEASGTALGQPEPVTTPSPYSGYLSISRDGRRIAYAHVTSAENLFKIGFDPSREATTGQPTAITDGTRSTRFPDLSGNGEWVTAVIVAGGQEDIVVVRTDGTGFRKLTDDAPRDRGPKWSPDGKTIAFYSERSGSFQIWTIKADGSGLRQLTAAAVLITDVLWSPDGTRLAFRNPLRAQTPERVLVLDVRKPWSEQTPEVIPFSLPDGVAFAPGSWSADGRQLAIAAFGLDPSAGTYVYDFETRQVQKVSKQAALGSYPRWLSDSRRLLVGDGGRLNLIDPPAATSHEVLSVSPDAMAGYSLSRDNRLIVYGIRSNRADIWLASAEDRAIARQP
jgi:Tol biopolymer transport system component